LRIEAESAAFIHAGCAGLREKDNALLIARAERAERAFADECGRSAELRDLLAAANDQIARLQSDGVDSINRLNAALRRQPANTINHLDSRSGWL
jgi:IS5 family transposase